MRATLLNIRSRGRWRDSAGGTLPPPHCSTLLCFSIVSLLLHCMVISGVCDGTTWQRSAQPHSAHSLLAQVCTALVTPFLVLPTQTLCVPHLGPPGAPASSAYLQARLPPACAVSVASSGHGNPSLPPTELPMHGHQGPALEADPFQAFPSASTHLSHIIPFRVLFPSL